MAIQFTNYRLFIDPVNQVIFKDYGDLTQLTNMTFTEGDKVRLNLYITKQTVLPETPQEVIAFPSGTVKVQVGTPGSAHLISTSTATSLSTPTISATTVGSDLSPFTISDGAQTGFFAVTIANASPSLSSTTAFLSYPIDLDEMATAIETAVNAQAGWSAATCQVLQTGNNTGTISLKATNATVVRTISGVTSNIGFTSNLTGLSGKYVDLDFSAAAIGTFLGAETSKTSYLEVQVTDSGDTQTYIQTPITIRAQVEDPA